MIEKILIIHNLPSGIISSSIFDGLELISESQLAGLSSFIDSSLSIYKPKTLFYLPSSR